MSSDRKPIARLQFRRDGQTFGILTVWPGKFAGTYDIARDKPTDRFPSIGLLDALRAWGDGSGYLTVRYGDGDRGKAANGPSGGPRGGNEGSDGFGDSDIPF